MAKTKTNAGKTIRVRLFKSINGCQGRHRTSVRALGLRKTSLRGGIDDGRVALRVG